jgi:hypothetical protein
MNALQNAVSHAKREQDKMDRDYNMALVYIIADLLG